MSRRIRRLVLTVASLATLALGGPALAQAQSSPSSTLERAAAPDRDNVQSGDQTTRDTPVKVTAQKAGHRHHRAVRVVKATIAAPADAGNLQSGDQSTPDSSNAAGDQAAAENPEPADAATESAPGADGLTGHADEPSNAAADHQVTGAE